MAKASMLRGLSEQGFFYHVDAQSSSDESTSIQPKRAVTTPVKKDTEGKQKEEEEDSVDNIFEAVVSAALHLMVIGGRKKKKRAPSQQEGSDTRRIRGVRLHAIIPFTGCAFISALQVMLLGGVALEVKQDKMTDELMDSFNNLDMSVITDVGLLFIVQAMIFSEIHQAITCCMYVVQTAWSGAGTQQRGSRFWFDMFLAFVANIFKVIVSFCTSKVSLSVILSNSKLTDRIFNSLALTFILELDNKAWEIVVEAFDVRATKPDRLGKRDMGGARCIGFFIIGLLYIHQTMTALFTLSTGWLPTTLTICNWRFRTPMGLFNAKGWGAQAMKIKLEYCDEHPDGHHYVDMYKVDWHDHPILMSCVILFIGLGVLAVFAKDKYLPEEDDDEDTEASSITSDIDLECDSAGRAHGSNYR